MFIRGIVVIGVKQRSVLLSFLLFVEKYSQLLAAKP